MLPLLSCIAQSSCRIQWWMAGTLTTCGTIPCRLHSLSCSFDTPGRMKMVQVPRYLSERISRVSKPQIAQISHRLAQMDRGSRRGAERIVAEATKRSSKPTTRSSPAFLTCFPKHPSLFTIHASRSTLHASRFTLHASRFTPHASRFTLHASRFTLHDSRFTIHDSRSTFPPRSREKMLS